MKKGGCPPPFVIIKAMIYFSMSRFLSILP